jgi:hypothetical protein
MLIFVWLINFDMLYSTVGAGAVGARAASNFLKEPYQNDAALLQYLTSPTPDLHAYLSNCKFTTHNMLNRYISLISGSLSLLSARILSKIDSLLPKQVVFTDFRFIFTAECTHHEQ